MHQLEIGKDKLQGKNKEISYGFQNMYCNYSSIHWNVLKLLDFLLHPSHCLIWITEIKSVCATIIPRSLTLSLLGHSWICKKKMLLHSSVLLRGLDQKAQFQKCKFWLDKKNFFFHQDMVKPWSRKSEKPCPSLELLKMYLVLQQPELLDNALSRS